MFDVAAFSSSESAVCNLLTCFLRCFSSALFEVVRSFTELRATHARMKVRKPARPAPMALGAKSSQSSIASA